MGEFAPDIQGLALDFDGVLADTIGAHSLARVEAFEPFGYFADPGLHEEAHRHGTHAPEIIGWVLKQMGIVPAGADVLTDPTVAKVVSRKTESYFAQAEAGLNATPGSVEYVQWAYEKYGSERLAIATTATREHEVSPFLRRYGLANLIGHIIAAEGTPAGRMKPDPFVYERAAELIQLPAGNIEAVEDSPRGVVAAKAAGLYVTGITTTHSVTDLNMADRVVGSFHELQ